MERWSGLRQLYGPESPSISRWNRDFRKQFPAQKRQDRYIDVSGRVLNLARTRMVESLCKRRLYKCRSLGRRTI